MCTLLPVAIVGGGLCRCNCLCMAAPSRGACRRLAAVGAVREKRTARSGSMPFFSAARLLPLPRLAVQRGVSASERLPTAKPQCCVCSVRIRILRAPAEHPGRSLRDTLPRVAIAAPFRALAAVRRHGDTIAQGLARVLEEQRIVAGHPDSPPCHPCRPSRPVAREAQLTHRREHERNLHVWHAHCFSQEIWREW